MGEYIRLFDNHNGYGTFTQTEKFVKPNVSHCVEYGHVHYNPIPHDYSKDYLTFVALEDGATFTFDGTTVDNATNVASYSIDGGETWTEIASGVSTPTINTGARILWKGEMNPLSSSSYGIGTFTATKDFDVEGNVMSLLFGDDFIGQTSLEGKSFALQGLFKGNANIINAKNLSLPATTLTNFCYASMFRDCTNLTTAPQLPATTLTNECYMSMFSGCTNLTQAPELPATQLTDYCYNGMFYGCTSLTTAPELPATTLAETCYEIMFMNCTSLTTSPELPATTLADACYSEMFHGCTSLTTAPELPATTLANYCYYKMFSGCTNLNSVTCLATNISAIHCTTNWLSDVAASGTFIKAASMTGWTTGVDGIPTNWTVQTASA